MTLEELMDQYNGTYIGYASLAHHILELSGCAHLTEGAADYLYKEKEFKALIAEYGIKVN